MSASGHKGAGAIEYIKGKLQRIIGKQTGNRSTQAKGFGHQAKGGARYEAGKARGKMKKKK
jgi:uncharacterized protein YjbJ (UPF0337 family)